jgi:hypothetical protein
LNAPVRDPHRPDAWPTAEQTLLLQAALFDGDRAHAAFAAWHERAAGSRLDPGSRRLLPLLYLNLRAIGLPEPGDSPYFDAYARAEAGNAALVEAVAPVLHAFHRAGIESAVLKGLPLALRYYPAPGARPMGDADVLVRPAQAEHAAGVLAEQRWQPDAPLDAGVRATVHAMRFTHPSGQLLDLHWHVQPETSDEAADETLWAAMERLDVDGAPAQMLCPADMVQHVCVHGLRWSTTPPVRWAADALVVLRRAGSRMDWSRLRDRATRHGAALPMHDALAFLCDALDAPVPDGVLERLSAVRPSRSERLEYDIKLRPRSPARLAMLHWFRHRRRRRGSLGGDLMRFPKYLQRVWGLRPR